MTDMPERIWTVHWNTDGAVMNGAWADTVRHFGGGVEYVRADLIRDAVLAGMRIATSTSIEMVPVAILDAIDEIMGGARMTDMNEVWSYKMAAAECELECKALRAQRDAAEAKSRESALDALAAYGQASDAYEAQLKAEAMAEKLSAALTCIRNYCANGPISQGEINCAAWANTALAEYEASK